MAQIFLDSFSGYRTADLPTRYPGGSTGAIVSAPLPPGAQAGAQVLQGGGEGLSSNIGPKARLIMGYRHYRIAGAPGFMATMLNASGSFSNQVCGVWSSNVGTFFYGNGGNLIATGPTVPLNEWHHYEFDVTFGNAANATLTLYLDGNPTPFMQATGVTLNAATASYFALETGTYNGAPFDSTGAGGYFADLYVFDGTGPAPFNAALAPQGLGAAKMAFAVPTGPGVVSDWTPNGAATIWQCIDQIPQDGDTTYTSDATPGDQYQCVFGALPPMQTLIGVQLSTYARTDDAGPRAYQSGFWHAGTFGYSGIDRYLGGSYNYIQDEFMTNPVTGLAWAVADLAGLQFGAKLTV